MIKELEEMKNDAYKLIQILQDCRNELCLKCGNYKESHLGKCDGCRWK